ncbi:MAG: hypothetical protein ACR2MS_02315 [Weeksellaceae bacterium]
MPISSWTDRLGGLSLIQPDANKQPIVGVDAGGFKHAIYSGGFSTEDVHSGMYIDIDTSLITQPSTIITIATYTPSGGSKLLIDNTGYKIRWTRSSSEFIYSTKNVEVGLAPETKTIRCASFNNDKTRFYIHNFNAGTGDTGVGSVGGRLFIGQRAAPLPGWASWSGEIHAVLLGDGYRSYRDLKELSKYLEIEHGAS